MVIKLLETKLDNNTESIWKELVSLPDEKQAQVIRHLFGSMQWSDEFLENVKKAIEYAQK
jgi:hypothetical protein